MSFLTTARAAGSRCPPVIIVGMHRSGTTVLTGLLRKAGLFIGHEVEINNESTYFLSLNKWILAQAGARWDIPEPLPHLMADPTLKGKVLDQLRHMMSARPCREYLGREGHQQWDDLARQTRPWGWKDPRTTLTLPLWREVFPDARVINVLRHGVDVAASLRHRSRAEMKPWAGGYEKLEGALITSSARCLTLSGAFSLWSTYLAEAERHLRADDPRLLTLRFEDLLVRPAQEVERLLTFCGLPCSPAALRDAQALLQRERGFAYREDAELKSFAGTVRSELNRFGYDA